MASGSARLGDSGDTGSGGHNDSPHPNPIIVPDAQLLFSANLSRSGHDLILTATMVGTTRFAVISLTRIGQSSLRRMAKACHPT